MVIFIIILIGVFNTLIYLESTIPLHLEVGRDTGYFHYRSYLDYILNKFGLLKIIDNPNTTEPVKVAVIFDGRSISRFLGHVTGGFKLVDGRAKHPRTKESLLGDSGHNILPSHIHCFPVKMVMAKDTKELHRNEFGDFFLFLKEYEQEKGFSIKFFFPPGHVIYLEDNGAWRYSKGENIYLLLLFSNNIIFSRTTT
jgi:hypothetical protein